MKPESTRRRRHPVDVVPWLRIAVLLLVGGLLIWLALTPTGRSTARATLLVIDRLSGQPQSLLHLTTAASTTDTVIVPTDGGAIEGRYYRPSGEGITGALILSLGYPVNVEDQQLVRLADDLSRLGVAVLIPRLPALHEGILDRGDVDVLVSSFEWLAARPEIDAHRVGFAGFCVGSSLAVVAAEDLRINERVALVNVFGGYYDLASLLRSVLTSSVDDEGVQTSWQPAYQTVELFARNVMLMVRSPAERVLITERLNQPLPIGQPPPELSPEGRLAYLLLTAKEPADVDSLTGQIPQETRLRMAEVSPSTNIADLEAKVFVMRDPSDPFVPSVESDRLERAIADPGRVSSESFVIFDHVSPSPDATRRALLGDGVRLISYLGAVLAELE